MRLIPYAGIRFTGRGLRPYAGLRLSLLSSKRKPVRQASHKVTLTYYCSACKHVNPVDAHFCNGCGAMISGPINYSHIPQGLRP